MLNLAMQMHEDVPSYAPGDEPRRGPLRADNRDLDALALSRARLAWLEARSTSEQLPAGHWLVISPENLLERLVEITDHVQALAQKLVGAARDREPAVGTGADLLERLSALCTRFLADTGIACELAVDGEQVRLGARAAEAVYWTLCELLANVRKHAGATRVKVSGGFLEGEFVYFRVEDDGVGMPIKSRTLETGGLGLWNVEQHVMALGGTLEIESGAGVRATIVLPRS